MVLLMDSERHQQGFRRLLEMMQVLMLLLLFFLFFFLFGGGSHTRRASFPLRLILSDRSKRWKKIMVI